MTKTFTRLSRFATSLLCLFLACTGLAQQPAAGPTPSEQDLRKSGLETSPFVAESLGLSLHLPAGSSAITESVDSKLALSISDSQMVPTWTVRVHQMIPSKPQPVAAGQIADLLTQYKANGESFKLIGNRAVTYGGKDGQLCYLERVSPQGEPYVTGWLVVPNGTNSFLVFALQTLPEHLPRIRPVLEASFATIRLESVEEIALQRRARLDAGRAFLHSITPPDLKKVVGQAQWHRIYRPDAAAEGGQKEIGYSLVEVVEAKRGAVSDGRAESSYTAAEQQPGILVRVQARLVLDAARRDFYDSLALYWMSWDQSEEAWSVLGTRRQGDAEFSESESGVREARSAGSPVPRLSVIKRTENTDPVPYEWEVPEGYLSQALGWLVGRLLPRDATAPREMAFYSFVSSNIIPKVYQRLDEWKPDAENSGQWTLTTRFASEAPPFTSTYGKDGKLIRRVHADGSVTEPITVEALNKIWKAKGLKVGKTGR